MSTLNKEKEFVEHLVQKLDEHTNENVEVIPINDYSDDRSDLLVLVGVQNSTQVNVGLPDYQYTVEVMVDGFIAGDRYGAKFEQAKNQILQYLETYIMDRTRLPELFDPIPVVGFFLDRIDNSTTEESNRTTISLNVIISYPV